METGLLEKCEYYTAMQVWPIEPKLNAEDWLSNFLPQERRFAESLLSSFLFFNEKMCKSMLKSAFHNISSHLKVQEGISKQEQWHHFRQSCIFSTIDITEVNPCASGHLMCRRVRDILQYGEERILPQSESLARLHNRETKYLVLVDDIIGSGMQFTDTWTSIVNTRLGQLSYPSVCSAPDVEAFYIPLIGTEYGIKEIRKTCKDITILPANILDSRYSVFHAESFVWPDGLRLEATQFLHSASKRAGIPEGLWEGHEKMGLTLAFHHSTPDLTLPLFTWDKNNWKPLLERS